MNRFKLVSAVCLLGLASYVHAGKHEQSDAAANDRSWADRLEYVGVAVEEPGYHVWGASPVIGPEGKIHLFGSRWLIEEGFGAWMTHCEIARYESDHPEGPFEFKDVIVTGTGKGGWDHQSPHNPNIQKIGDRYALVYIANSGGKKKDRAATQRIGMMVADHPAGPWKKVGDDGLLLSPPEDPEVWSYESTVGVNNPALFEHPDGRFFLYYKAMRKGDVRRMGVAIADNLEGPYVFEKEPLTSNDSTIEDGYAFQEGEHIYLLTTHNDVGAGYLWRSSDGLQFGQPLLGYDKMSTYIAPEQLESAEVVRGKKFERPQLLLKDGKPQYLYVACGSNWNGGKGSYSCVIKINEASTVAESQTSVIRTPPENLQNRWFFYQPEKYIYVEEYDMHIFGTATVSDWMMHGTYDLIQGMVGALKEKAFQDAFRGHQTYVVTDADPALNKKGQRNTGGAGFSLFNEALVCREAVDTFAPNAAPKFRGWNTPVHEFGHAIEFTLKLQKTSDQLYTEHVKRYNPKVKREYIAWAVQKWFSSTASFSGRDQFEPWEYDYLATIFNEKNMWLPDNSPRPNSLVSGASSSE